MIYLVDALEPPYTVSQIILYDIDWYLKGHADRYMRILRNLYRTDTSIRRTLWLVLRDIHLKEVLLYVKEFFGYLREHIETTDVHIQSRYLILGVKNLPKIPKQVSGFGLSYFLLISTKQTMVWTHLFKENHLCRQPLGYFLDALSVSTKNHGLE